MSEKNVQISVERYNELIDVVNAQTVKILALEKELSKNEAEDLKNEKEHEKQIRELLERIDKIERRVSSDVNTLFR